SEVACETLRVVPKEKPLRTIDQERFAALRRAKGLTVDVDLQKVVQSTQVYSWRGMRGRASVPHGDRLELLCQALECSPLYLFGRPIEECEDWLVKVAKTEISEDVALALAAAIRLHRARASTATTAAVDEVTERWEESGPSGLPPVPAPSELPKPSRRRGA